MGIHTFQRIYKDETIQQYRLERTRESNTQEMREMIVIIRCLLADKFDSALFDVNP